VVSVSIESRDQSIVRLQRDRLFRDRQLADPLGQPPKAKFVAQGLDAITVGVAPLPRGPVDFNGHPVHQPDQTAAEQRLLPVLLQVLPPLGSTHLVGVLQYRIQRAVLL
jgi:hypothetical protein